MSIDPGVQRLLDTITSGSGREALSEAKVRRLEAGAREVVTVTEDDVTVAVGVAASHRQTDDSLHWAIETAVVQGMSFPEFEGAVLDATLQTVPHDVSMSVWSSRAALDAALIARRFSVNRRLVHMAVALPLERVPVDDPRGTTIIRSFRMDDVDALLGINRRAFAGHREAASLDRSGFEELMEEPWFDPAGIFVADRGDATVGFCWTKVHPDGAGEIYRIAVDPLEHGRGLGRSLVLHGFAALALQRDVERGTLWVEETNTAAIGLYESIGMRRDWVRTEFERPQPNR